MKIILNRKDLAEPCRNLKIDEIKYDNFKSNVMTAILIADMVTFEDDKDNNKSRIIKNRYEFEPCH